MNSCTSTAPTSDLLRSGCCPSTACTLSPANRRRLEPKRQLLAVCGHRNLRWRSPREALERPGQMRLVRVPGPACDVDRGNALGQQFYGAFGPADLGDGPAGQPRGPGHSSLDRAPGQAFDLTP